MKSDSVVVKQSRIQGRGVFAARNFKKGEVVLHWDTSKSLSATEAKNIGPRLKHFLIVTGGKRIIAQAPERYINHSCEPNTKVKGFSDLAIRPIKKGEEITSNYAADLAPGFKMKCKCGSNKCRGVITRKPSR